MEDLTLWNDFRNGKEQALSYIYYHHAEFLFLYGQKFTDDKELISDVIQDLFYDLIRTRKRLGSTDNIRFYLARSFRRKLSLEIKKSKTKFGELTEKEMNFSINEEMTLDEKSEVLNQGLKELNSKQREILYYKFNCEFSYEQICEIMSISYDSARQMVSRSINSLKKILANHKMLFLALIFRKLYNTAKK